VKSAEYAARSDVGCVRVNNEDAYGAFPDFGIWCVADGMGGGDDGEIASSSVVRMLHNALISARADSARDLTLEERIGLICEVTSETSQWLKERSQAVGLQMCGSTVVGVAVDENGRFSVFHAGDSRAYLCRRGKLERLTKDHSFAEALHVRESKLPPQMRSAVLRAVGIEGCVDLDVTQHEWIAEDVILLCSDGLTRMVPDAEIRRILSTVTSCNQMSDALVSAAKRAGGVDNVTVVVLRLGQQGI